MDSSPQATNSSHAPLPALTSLRFFLALWVVLLHGADYLEYWLGSGPSWGMNFVRCGYLGVNVFFVLSGFILAYNYVDAPQDSAGTQRFWWFRFARIYPIYLLGIVLYFPIALYKDREMAVEAGAGWLATMSGTSTSLAAALALVQSWFPQFALRWNPPAWSVSAEAFFYLLFPWVLFGLNRLCGRSLGRLVIVGIVAWLASLVAPLGAIWADIPGFSDLSAAASAHLESADPRAYFVRFNPLLRLPEFVVGVVCGLGFVRIGSRRASSSHLEPYAGLCTVVGTVGLMLTSAVASPYLPLPLVHNGLCTPFAVLIVVGLAYQTRGISTASWLQRLGDASYAMYILQWPIRSYLRFGEQKLLPAVILENAGGWLLFVYIGLVVLAGLLSLVIIEQPARSFLRRNLRQVRNLTTGGEAG